MTYGTKVITVQRNFHDKTLDIIGSHIKYNCSVHCGGGELAIVFVIVTCSLNS